MADTFKAFTWHTVRTNAPGLHGWHTISARYASVADALATVDALLRDRRTIQVEVFEVRDGRRVRVANHKRRKA